ncbi:MAG: S-layer y domain [Chthonomonadales bacterium]|nr:S-layer y domain [Chthonomonadales bacterium]
MFVWLLSSFAFNDAGGAFRPANNSFFNKLDTPHDFHLIGKADLPEGIKFNGDLLVSNYASYRSSLTVPGILFGGPSTANTNGFPEQVTLYEANIQVPIGGFGSNTQITIGRFKNQVTPLTYFRPDTDPYFDLPWYDDGNYVQDGFLFNTRCHGIRTQLWAGSYKGLTTNVDGDFINRPFVGLETGPRTLSFGKPTDYPIPFTQGAGIANQSAGLHIDAPLFKYGELGLTLIDFTTSSGGVGGFPFANNFSNVLIYGADVKLKPFGRFQIDAEASKSVTATDFDHGDGQSNEDNNAFNLNLGYKSGPFDVQTGYQYIDPRFGAPGYWDKIGNWYNPTNVQGPFARIHYQCTPRLGIRIGGDYRTGARNRSIQFAPGVGGWAEHP